MSYSSTGAVATLWSPTYRVPPASSSRYSTSTRLSSSTVSDRPYYSSTLGNYSSSSRYTSSSSRSSTVPSYTRIDNHEKSSSRLLTRDRESKEENSYLSRSIKTSSDLGSTLDRFSSTSGSYKLPSRYLTSSSTSSSSSSTAVSGVSLQRKYGSASSGAALSSPSPSRVSSSTTTSEVTNESNGVLSEHRPSVDELRRRFDTGVLLSVHNLNNHLSPTNSTRASPEVTNTNSSKDKEVKEESSNARDRDEPAESDAEEEEVENDEDELEDPLKTTSAAVSIEERKKGTRFTSNEVLDVSSSSPRLTSSKSAEKGGLNGLRNIGNTCFMNSVIQCLSNTRPLLEYLSQEEHLSDINTTISSMKGALIKAFASVVQELWAPNAEDRIVNTSAFKAQVQRFAPRFMGYSQQDAQEFLRYLLEGLHEDVNRVTVKPKPITSDIDDSLSDNQKANEAWKRYLRIDDSKVMDIFVGQLKSTLQCTVCGHCSVTFDPFWDLSLPVPSRTGSLRLQACLDAFTKEEVLDGDEKPTCSKCQTRRKCTKSFSIQKFPKILVLHLKRFSPTERFRGKLSNTVEFPLTGLDLSAYAAGRGQGCTYNLYAVSNHSGTTYSGHYTAYCKHPYSASWHEYNDSRVCALSSRSIVSGEAYVLFYELSSQTSHL